MKSSLSSVRGLDWVKQSDGSYTPTNDGMPHRYVILRDRENKVYRPQADGVAIGRPKGYFNLKDAKMFCAAHSLGAR